MTDGTHDDCAHESNFIQYAAYSDIITQDALEIWQYGVDAVRADYVVESQTNWDGRWLSIGDQTWDLKNCKQLILLGAGKASDSMAIGFLNALRKSGRPIPKLTGWINVPERLTPLPVDFPESIHVCQARPQGKNQPTELVVSGTQQILRLASQATSSDCVIAFISGGGSALLCSPIDGLSLSEKVAITNALSSSGANIEQLNSVRRCLSRVKGGGLARACRAKNLITCILSDVLGDPIEIIASGPTVLTPAPDPKRAIEILDQFVPNTFQNIRTLLRHNKRSQPTASLALSGCELDYVLMANNATAVDSAGQKAVELGYQYWMQSAAKGDGDVDPLGERIASQILATCGQNHIDCLISGGEPTVTLPPMESRGLGGRNQQLALSVLIHLEEKNQWPKDRDLVFLSGGTDGEDGPTQAAGALVNRFVLANMRRLGLDPRDYFQRCDAYRFFEQTQGLLVTGPTGTNVCDLRITLLSLAFNP